MRKLLSALLLGGTLLLGLGVTQAAPAPDEWHRRSVAPRVYYPRHSVRARAYRYRRYSTPGFRRTSEAARYRRHRYYRTAPLYMRRHSEMPRRSY